MVRNFSSNKDRTFYSVYPTNSGQSLNEILRKKATPQSRTFSFYTKTVYRTLDLLVVGLGDESNSFIFISVHKA